MELTLCVSPSPEIALSCYDSVLFPKFRSIFEGSQSQSPLRLLVREPQEANTAVVMENRSDRDITALRYCWVVADEDGSEKKHTVSADSYMVDVYHPVLGRGDRKLISWSTTVDESLIDHVLRGGGYIGATFYSPHVDPINSLRFELDFVLFMDGEIAGPDKDRYAVQLRCRKPAAEFVAKQIRLAESKGRDVTPVLSAITEIPHIGNLRPAQGDLLVYWIKKYAGDYLGTVRHNIGTVNSPEAKLRHLENRPVLPKFHRGHSSA
jgi:hypothetical protein